MAPAIAESSAVDMVHSALQRISISSTLGCSSQTILTPNNVSEMGSPRSVSTSPSRSRTLKRGRNRKCHIRGHKPLNLDLPSRDSSQTRYSHYTFCDGGLGQTRRPAIVPRYVESFQPSQADGCSSPQHETTSTPPDSGGQLTPSTNTSSRIIEDCLPQQPIIPNSLCNNHLPEPEVQNSALECDVIKQDDSRFDACSTNEYSRELLSDKDDEMDNESETDEHSTDEHWVSADEDFEASVLRITGNNFTLAARLIPQLHEILTQEESPIIGFWKTSYRTCPGNPYDQSSETGRGGSSLSNYQSQNPSGRKRQKKEGDEDDGQDGDNEEGNRDGDRGIVKGRGSGSYAQPVACPFNKKYPSKYNASYRPPHGRKGVYRTCATGFDNDQRFKEHLMRQHRFVQCEQCAQLFDFSGDWKRRQLAFQTHRSPLICRHSPPEVNEGITELQWARIDKLPRQNRSIGNSNISVVKWTAVYKILYPGEEAPQPWFTPDTTSIRHFSPVDQEIPEFINCYKQNQQLSPLQNAIQAFETWYVKRLLEQPLQLSCQSTLKKHAGTDKAHSPAPKGQAPLPNADFQERTDMGEFSLHQQALASSSNQEPLPSRPSTTESYAGYQANGQMQDYIDPNASQLADQQNMPLYRDLNSMMIYGASEQPMYTPERHTPAFTNHSSLYGNFQSGYTDSSNLALFNNDESCQFPAQCYDVATGQHRRSSLDQLQAYNNARQF